MSRRPVSPLRTINRTQSDPRDQIIRKLKDELILARGREKELALMDNYLIELKEKTKLMEAEKAKADEEGRIKLELSIKTINELKRQVEALRNQLRSLANELGAVEEEQDTLKKHLSSRTIELQKMKKEGVSLHEQNEKLINEQYRLKSQDQQTIHQIRKLHETIRNYQIRVNQISHKIMEVKAFINQMAEKNAFFKDKLKNYTHKNQGIDSDIDRKEVQINTLQKVFDDLHEEIKNRVENYIQIEHRNEKCIKQAKHKLNLIKLENDKGHEIGIATKKVEKIIAERSKNLSQVKIELGQLNGINEDFSVQNAKFKQDLAYCREHLQNLLKHNSYIQQQMENFVREDEAIINVIRRKRIIPVTMNYASLRTSRNEERASNRTYK